VSNTHTLRKKTFYEIDFGNLFPISDFCCTPKSGTGFLYSVYTAAELVFFFSC